MICEFCGKNTDEQNGVCRYCGKPVTPLRCGNGFYDILSKDQPVQDTPQIASQPLRHLPERRQKRSNINMILPFVSVAALVISVVALIVGFSNKPDKKEQEETIKEFVEQQLKENSDQEQNEASEQEQNEIEVQEQNYKIIQLQEAVETLKSELDEMKQTSDDSEGKGDYSNENDSDTFVAGEANTKSDEKSQNPSSSDESVQQSLQNQDSEQKDAE